MYKADGGEMTRLTPEIVLREKRSFVIEVTEPILGSWPANEELFTRFVKSKAPKVPDEIESDENPPLEDSPGLTIFPRDKNGVIHLYDYHIKGFLKESANNLAHQIGIAALRSKVGNFVFVEPRRVYMRRENGDIIVGPDDIKERPLRAQTMQGPRTTLVASELINPPIFIEVDIALIVNKWMSWDDIIPILSYGMYQGLCQWRNAGWGRFNVYEVESKRDKNYREEPKKRGRKKTEAEAIDEDA